MVKKTTLWFQGGYTEQKLIGQVSNDEQGLPKWSKST